jgi:16S rRNA (uracil1498-N3)-methyltransferase
MAENGRILNHRIKLMPLFLISPHQIKGNQAILDKTESHHLIHVHRKKVGDLIGLMDGRGNYLEGKILAIDDSVRVEILSSKTQSQEVGPSLILCQAILKNPRMDWLIEKATELGAHAIVPFLSHRDVVKIESESEKSKKIKRWEKIATAALKQSGRGKLPQIGPILTWTELMKKYEEVDALKLLFTLETSGSISLGDLSQRISKNEKIPLWIFVIGPEGGFTESEIEQARNAGFELCSLGDFTLRAETAALAVLSILNFLK